MTAFLVEGEQGLTWMVDGGQAFATVKDDSTFEIKLPQGHAVIRLTGTPEWRIKRARLNGIDVTEHGFDVPAGGILSQPGRGSDEYRSRSSPARSQRPATGGPETP